MLPASKICVRYLSWGPSINDVILEGEGGCANVEIWGDDQGIIWVTRGGSSVKNLENWVDIIYGLSFVKENVDKKIE